jgi:hypothetical protein
MRGLYRLSKSITILGAAKVIACTVPGLVYRSFHGAKERFDWLIVSQQGDLPIDLLITSRIDKFPLFVRPRKERYGFDTPQK